MILENKSKQFKNNDKTKPNNQYCYKNIDI